MINDEVSEYESDGPNKKGDEVDGEEEKEDVKRSKLSKDNSTSTDVTNSIKSKNNAEMFSDSDSSVELELDLIDNKSTEKTNESSSSSSQSDEFQDVE